MDDEDNPTLSSHALAALQQFYQESDEQQQRFEKLNELVARDDGVERITMNDFVEDWSTSQFWYHDDTSSFLAKELLEGATSSTRIAIISAPSVFVQLHNMLSGAGDKADRPSITLLEHDSRFNVFPDFVYYDFEQPTKLDPAMKGIYDRLLVDPPFLSDDCQTKVAMTVRWLAKPAQKQATIADGARLVVCTGERMEPVIHRLYPGIRTTTFEPAHAHGLGNEFRTYANYESKSWAIR